MKSILMYLLMLASINFYAQERRIKVIIKTAENSKGSSWEKYYYDESGKEIRISKGNSTNGQFLEFKKIYTNFDMLKQEIIKKKWNDHYIMVNYVYDKNQNLIEKNEYKCQDSIYSSNCKNSNSTERYEYNVANQRISTATINKKGYKEIESETLLKDKFSEVQKIYFYYDKFQEKSEKNDITYQAMVISNFDKEGREISRVHCNKNKPCKSTFYSFDKNGNLVSEKDDFYKTSYFYNDDNLLMSTEELHFSSNRIIKRVEYIYNNKELVKETTRKYSSKDTTSLPKSETMWSYSYEYY